MASVSLIQGSPAGRPVRAGLWECVRHDPVARRYTVTLPAGIALVDALRSNMSTLQTRGWVEGLPGVAASFAWEWISVVLPLVLAIASVFAYGPRGGYRHALLLVLAEALGTLWGVLLFHWHPAGTLAPADAARCGLCVVLDGPLFGALLILAYEFHVRGVAHAEAFQQEGISRIALDTERDRAHLHALRAQIEPHFLFNTLATIRRLYQVDRQEGEGMLGNLLRYLDVPLTQRRGDYTTLGEEAGLVEAYLGIHRVRMGTRLTYDVAIPAALRGRRVASMLLVPLVENAIKHGLDPLPEGGHVRVSAEDGEHMLLLRVADTGRGIDPGTETGSGSGLDTLRAWLLAHYGTRARLGVAANAPHGVVVTLALPRAPLAPGP